MKNAVLTLAAVIGLVSAALAGQPSNNSHNSSHHEYSEYSHNDYSYKSSHHEYSEYSRSEFSRDSRNSYYVNTSRSFPTDYHLRYGVKFEHGYFYEGFEHNHWSKIYFNNIYGCKIYFDPYTRVEYYWCLPDHRFYPVSYKPYGKYVF